MKQIVLALVGVALVAQGAAVAGQSKSGSLQGVWQTVEITIASQPPRTMTVSTHALHLTIFTAKHYSRTEEQSDTPRPVIADVSKATADELRATWGPFVAEAGTYEVSGTSLTLHPLAAKSPAAMAPGAFIANTFKLDGDTLTISQVRNQSGPYQNPVTFKLTRIE